MKRGFEKLRFRKLDFGVDDTFDTVAAAAAAVAECVVMGASLYRGWWHVGAERGGIDCIQHATTSAEADPCGMTARKASAKEEADSLRE